MQDRAAAAPAYRPNARDYQYVEALKAWLSLPSQTATRARLAAMAGMPANKLAAYESHPARMAWVRSELAGDRRDDQWERLVDRALYRAMDGKIEWALFFARAIGRFGPTENAASLANGPTSAGPSVLIFQIPRPEPLLEGPKPVGASSTIPHDDILDLTGTRR